uniref:Metallo-beta-lactamase domain-containing protein n=1 Tax=Aegilops tauschii subsp. strangulata TaxID=200361 RepID=A0A453LQI1_AEGTS
MSLLFAIQVMHGEGYVCLGFLFGRKARVAYLSDVSRILPRTEHNSYAIKRICLKKALLIGMNHEFEHHRENRMLTEWSHREGIPVQLAHDGLRIFIDL